MFHLSNSKDKLPCYSSYAICEVFSIFYFHGIGWNAIIVKIKTKEGEDMRRTDREVKDAEGILQIIESCKVCRIGMMDGEKIYIVPVNFGYIYEDEKLALYFHGAREGKKLELIRKNPAVGIEMDGAHELVTGKTACEYSYHYASLVGNGRAQIVTEPKEKLMALALIMKHQTGKDFEELEKNSKLGQAVGVIRVEAGEFTCKRHGAV